MLFLKLLNARLVLWLVIGFAGAAGALFLRLIAITSTMPHAVVQQAQHNREGMKTLAAWHLK
jgi:hypothetical protein